MADAKNKFDFNGLIGSLKAMINPAANIPTPNPNDALGIKLAELSVLVQQLQQSCVEQGKQLSQVCTLFNEVYQHLEELRAQSPVAPQEEVPAKEAVKPSTESDDAQ